MIRMLNKKSKGLWINIACVVGIIIIFLLKQNLDWSYLYHRHGNILYIILSLFENLIYSIPLITGIYKVYKKNIHPLRLTFMYLFMSIGFVVLSRFIALITLLIQDPNYSLIWYFLIVSILNYTTILYLLVYLVYLIICCVLMMSNKILMRKNQI